MKRVYLDHAATCPPDPEVLSAMLPFFGEIFGNPDSPHAYGRKAAFLLTEARDSVAEVLGVSPSEVYFTAGGTEANNQAVRYIGHGRAILSPIEHASALSAAPLRAGGYSFTEVPRGGSLTAENFSALDTSGADLLALMAVNNETGCMQPIKEAAAFCHERGMYLFSDCVQAACSQDLAAICRHADAVSLSAHKFGGPKGAGVLMVKRGVPLSPLLAGGEQEHRMRGGTVNVAGAVGLAFALKKAQAARARFCEHTGMLRDLFENRVLAALAEDALRDGEHRAPNLSHLTFRRGGEALLHRLDLNGVACSGGAACSAHSALPSHVMIAMGRTEEQARRGVRFSFGLDTSAEDALFAADTVISCYRALPD